MLHFFCINPIAGSVDVKNFTETIENVCKKENLDFRIFVSDYKFQIPEAVREAAEQTDDITVYAVGGDGTIYEAVNGIMFSNNKNAVLVPVPCGSGNDFVRTFGYNAGDDSFEKLIDKAIHSSVKEIDVMKINDKFGVNITSVGFDAKVVSNSLKIRKLKFIPNKMTYTASVFYTFITQGAYDVEIKTDGELLPYGKILLMAAANGQYYGGGMKPVPSASVEDGLIDLLIAEKVSKFAIPKFFPKYSKGEADKVRQVHLLRCGKIEISSEKDFPLNIDGEVSFTKKAIVEICERKLKIGILALDGNNKK